jgi:hypothetical protein
MLSNVSSENRAVYEKMWKMLFSRTGHRRQYGAYALYAGYLRLQTHSEYVIFIAFLRQQWLLQRASMLRHTCIACIVITQTECSLRGTTWFS